MRRSTLEASETLDLVAQAASTLSAAHAKGIVHGNITAANFILRSDGVLKITNFCVTRAVDAAPLMHAQVALDATAQRSPEQLAGRPPIAASDIYGLGLVAYECLTGVPPFDGEGPVSAAMAHLTEAPPPMPLYVPEDAAELVARMLDKDPSCRPADAATVAAEAVAACRRLGVRTSLQPRELLGGDAGWLL
jgi:serine/threonine-protein kinase